MAGSPLGKASARPPRLTRPQPTDQNKRAAALNVPPLVSFQSSYRSGNSALSALTMPVTQTSRRISPFSFDDPFGEERVPLAGVHSGFVGYTSSGGQLGGA